MNCSSLKKLCVKCIAFNLDNFILYCKSPHFLSALQIIQKWYSNQILEILFEQKALKNDHLHFLINKYTKQINLQYLAHCDFQVIEERLKDIGSVITVFCMPGVKRFCSIENLLRHVTKVQILDLSGSNCTDYILGIVSENCNDLKKLFIQGCEQVTDKGLLKLCEGRFSLESLNVEYTSVSYKGVAYVLKTIPTLTELWFNNVPRAICEASGINDRDDINCERVYNLRNLSILNNPLRPKNHLISLSRICALTCPMIKDLVVSEIVAEEQLDLCCNFTNLESVSLQNSKIVNLDLCINKFIGVRGEKLRSLTLISFSVSVELLAKCCPNLESLYLQYPIFEDIRERKFVFPFLARLTLQDADLDLKENWSPACIVSSSPGLRELQVVHCQMSSEMQGVILQIPPQLRFLNLSNTLVSFEYVEEILRVHTGLEKLVIDNSGISLSEYDDLLDMVDNFERKINIVWADYTEAIRELFYNDLNFNNSYKKMILKL